MAASVNTVCKKCGCPHGMPAYSRIDGDSDPAMKEKVLSGDLFKWTCPSCGTVNLVKYPLVYTEGNLLAVLSDAPLSVEAVPEGKTARRVRSIGELIEKVKIYGAGLNDIAVELCKYVTCHEEGIEAELKFLRLEGADNDMIFTYPLKGEMQLLSVGFRVYEESCAILSRHPDIKADGLALVDAAWIRGYLK